jgi:hypothetical protein
MHLKTLGSQEHNERQREVAFDKEFLPEFREFSEGVRRQAYSLIEMLKMFGPQLGRPRVDTLKGSKHSNMKELRFDAENGVWRVAFAFDLKRNAILLVGADKSGVSKDKFYRNLIDIADRRFDQHQSELARKKE